MFIVKIINDGEPLEIHGYNQKLNSGKIVAGINTIDSFSFTLNPANAGFNRLADYKTLIEVFNTNKARYEFKGRVLCSATTMSDSGLISKEVTCESYLGYLCDSLQMYEEEKNWTVEGLITQMLSVHNSQVESHKQIKLGILEVEDPNDNLYCGIQRKNTWEEFQEHLIKVLGGEVRIREETDGLYLDYLKKIGEVKTTTIELSKNMKSITQEKDPTSYITRLFPYGAKLYDESEERLTIESVTDDGRIYIDDEEAIAVYGIHCGTVEFDDITEPLNLYEKSRAWIKDNNKVQVKYQITALDLSLKGLDLDDFAVHNYYPVKNPLLAINDTARIIKKTIDICEEVKSTIEVGDNFKTLSDLQKEQEKKLAESAEKVGVILKDYVTNKELTNQLTTERLATHSLINQKYDSILTSVSATYTTLEGFNAYKKEVTAALELKIGTNDSGAVVSLINAVANEITITSDKFTLEANGRITATAGLIGGLIIEDNSISSGVDGLTFLSNGRILAQNIEVSERVWTKLVSGRNSGSAWIKMEGSTLGTENVTMSYSMTILDEGNDGLLFWKKGAASITVTADKALTASKTFELTLVYKSTSLGDIEEKSGTTVTIPMGSTTGSVTVDYRYPAGSYRLESVRINPSSFIQDQTTVTPSMYAYGDFIPAVSGFQLGSSLTRWGVVYANTGNFKTAYTDSGTVSVSDRAKKNAIAELPAAYSDLFDRLTPVTFKLNNGDSERLHTGLIAQDVKEILDDLGINTKDFAAYCEWEEDGGTTCGIRYTEFIPLLIAEVQKIKQKLGED